MLFQELPHQGRFVGQKVVEDDMNLLPRWAQCDDFLQESNEILTGMARAAVFPCTRPEAVSSAA